MNGADETLWLSRASDTKLLGQFLMIFTVMYDDESAESLGVDDFPMHGVQREIIGYLTNQGYEPAVRWNHEESMLGKADRDCMQCSR